MNTFKQLVGLEFDSFYKINIQEEDETYTLHDSILIAGMADKNRFQIFTNQTGISIFNLNEGELYVDGEYAIESILPEPILNTDKFVIEDIHCIWDAYQLYILAFVFYTSKEPFYFIRLSDEIGMVQKDVFDQTISNVKHLLVTEK